MRPRSCRPINCRPCLPLSASSEERHRPSPIASGSADVADQGVHPPADLPTPPLRNAAPSIRPSGEHRPANQRLPGRLSLAQPRAHHASGDRSVILRIVESRLAAREPQLRSRQHKVLSCLHENIISRNAQLLMSLRLDHKKEHAVQYRERDGIIAVFLLSRPTLHCGVVDAALDLTPLIRKGEAVEFKCYTDREGGTTWGKWGHVVGLADNQGGRKRFVTARLAWRVNINEKRFEEMKGEAVRCDTSGSTD